MKLGPHLLPYIKISSRWIKDLNLRPETVTILEDNIGKALLDTGKETVSRINKKSHRMGKKSSKSIHLAKD